MKTPQLTAEEIAIRREKFFREMNEEYPSIPKFVATNSGIVEPAPVTQDEWDNYHENLQYVDGVERVR